MAETCNCTADEAVWQLFYLYENAPDKFKDAAEYIRQLKQAVPDKLDTRPVGVKAMPPVMR